MIKLSHPQISKKSIEIVKKILESGNITQGKYVKKFEQKLQDFLGIKNVIVVSSGTAALHLALISLDIKSGDEVIIPAFSFPATANVVEIVGAKPIFVDISLDDYCIKTSLIEKLITDKTKAIIPVHEFGQPAKMDDIKKIAKKYNIKIIEDAACALGSEFKKKKIGTLGNIGCFSFHPRKIITTGEGGAIVTNDINLTNKIKALRNHGSELINGNREYYYAGLNYRMTDFQASMGISQLTDIKNIIKHRFKCAKIYSDYLSEISWITVPKSIENRKTNFQTYHLLIAESIDKKKLIDFLKKNMIQTNYGANSLHMLKYYQDKYNYNSNNFPNAHYAYNFGLALPMGNHVSINDVKKIAKKINLFY